MKIQVKDCIIGETYHLYSWCLNRLCVEPILSTNNNFYLKNYYGFCSKDGGGTTYLHFDKFVYTTTEEATKVY